MAHYWANFEQRGDALLRFDTRIYLNPRERPKRGDRPIGSIIGKNPGSAVPRVLEPGLQALQLQGDHFLPCVLSISQKAYAAAKIPVPANGYIQVLNLFYLCDRDLKRAKASLTATNDNSICHSERRRAPWTWFAWGGPDTQLDPLKTRFLRRRPRNPFFYDKESLSVVHRKPRADELAKHTQGMPHPKVVSHIASLLT